jgi:hypothetical protein
VFRCDRPLEEPRTSDEVGEFRWMTREEVKTNLDPAYACRLLDAFNGEGPRVRTHDGTQLL